MFNALFTKTDEYARLAQALGGPGACALFGIPGSGRAMVYAALAKALDKPLCIVTPGEAEATRFAGDLNALGVAAAVFPARDYVLRPIEGTGREYEYRRLAVLGDLVGGRLQAVCVPDEGLTQYTTPRADFCANTRSLRPGDTLPRAELTALLYGAGYTRRDQVDGPGQFSIRGDIADIYAPDMKQPARMEFWGDEIDTMHTFDLATQRRDEPIEKIYVSPAREILFGQPADAAEKIRSYIKKARGRRRTALETCTAADLAQLDGGAMPVNMDKYLMLRYPEPATILDYFDDPLLILEEPASLREAERATAFRRGEELSALLEDGVLAAGLDKLYAESGWLWAQCAAHRTLCAENFARSMPDVPLKTIVNAPAHTLPAWGGEVSALLEDIQPLCSGGTAVTVMSDVPDGQQLHVRRAADLPRVVCRDDALRKAQPLRLGQALLQMADRPDLAREAHLPHRGHRLGDGFVEIARGDGHDRREIRRRLVERQAADDVEVRVALADLQPAALFEHRQQHRRAVIVEAVAAAQGL